MSESPKPERPWHPDAGGDAAEPDEPMPAGDVGAFPGDHGWADAGEIHDLGTGDDPPESGE